MYIPLKLKKKTNVSLGDISRKTGPNGDQQNRKRFPKS
jgi:hypothetical protein